MTDDNKEKTEIMDRILNTLTEVRNSKMKAQKRKKLAMRRQLEKCGGNL